MKLDAEQWEQLGPRHVFAWAWQSVNVAFSAHAAELRDTSTRVPLRGLMLFAWNRGVCGYRLPDWQLDTLLSDTTRLGTQGEISQPLRDAVLGLHHLGRAAMVSREVDAGGSDRSRAHFRENLLLSLEHATKSHRPVADDARKRLALLSESLRVECERV
ncbi:hypothetical protein OAX78_02830 [Planctomycetota bacterium]|nr:hypothetical protein [Planctomycetota bacterium]